MIISHAHRFILIRLKKTAGTSIEQALIPALGEQDFHSYIDSPKHHSEAHHGRTRIIKRVGHAVWTHYLTVATVRNPWDRAVSQWFWYYKRYKLRRPPFADYLKTRVYAALIEFRKYMVKGRQAVDTLIRYEHPEDDFAAFCARAGLPELELPHHLGQFRDDDRRYQEFYTPQTAQQVARDFAPEIALHGYTFDA